MELTKRVNIRQGTVIGGEGVLPNGQSYQYFRGIPYAVPPLRELRFKAPIPLDKFCVPELECLEEGPTSVQQDRVTGKPFTGSEDCLYLNVYRPESNSNEPLPVMLYIHGGGYTTGNGNKDKHNPMYLLQEGVIVVTFNYRLGVLGFLSLPEAGIPGNAGLKDQVLVMNWVKENIAQFNGDPKNVTLFGHSTGGTCVHTHLYLPNSGKLFHKAIMQSGVANMPLTVDNDGPAKTRHLAKLLGCSSNNPKEILLFLQNVENLEEFIKPMLNTNRLAPTVPTRPVIEEESLEAVITKPFLELMCEPNSVSIPVLMGYTNAEGLSMISTCGENLKDFHNNFIEFIPYELNLSSDDPKAIEMADNIREFYFKGDKIDDKLTYQLSDLFGDSFFTSYIHEAAEKFTRYQHDAPLYFYRFDYDGQLNLYKRKYNVAHLKGASHVDELCYVYQMEFSPPQPWEEDAIKIIVTLCRMWANFAKFNNPTPTVDEEIGGCIWEPVSKVDNWENMVMKTLIFDKVVRMMDNPDEERITFWRNLRQYHK